MEIYKSRSVSNIFFKTIVVIFIVTDQLYTNTKFFNQLNYFDSINRALLILVACCFLSIIYNKKILRSGLITSSILLLISIVAYIHGGETFSKIIWLGLLLSILDVNEVVFVVSLASFMTIVTFTILSFSGILPLFSADGIIILGTLHKNGLGFMLTLVAAAALYYLRNNKMQKNCGLVIALIVSYVNWYFIEDRTAAIALVVDIIISYVIFNGRQIKSKIFMWLPVGLSIISWLCIYAYPNYNWAVSVDKVLSRRLILWKYVWTYFSPSLWQQNIAYGNRGIGDIYVGGSPMDGFFAVGALAYGYVVFISIMVLLVYLLSCLLKSSKYNDLLPYAICIIITSFTELNTCITTNVWLIPVAINFLINGLGNNENDSEVH